PSNNNQSPNIPTPNTPNVISPNIPSNNNQSPNIPTPNTPNVISPNLPSNNNQSPNIPTPNTPNVISPNIPSNNNQSPNIPTPNTPNVISPNLPGNNNQSPNIPAPINPDVISITTPSNNNQTANTPTAKDQTQGSINITTDTQTILTTIENINTNTLTVTTNANPVARNILEENRNNEYSDYLEEDLSEQLLKEKNVREILKDMANQTGTESAVIYVYVYQEQLKLILYTKKREPIIKILADVKEKQLMEVVLEFRVQITNPTRRYTDSYLPPAQQLYDWLIAPISAELEAANIDTLLFSMDEGLRTLPVAALHDGTQFLIEKYSLSLIPSVSLMDTNYRPLQDTQVLAMGASEFVEQNSLPAVPVELENITQQLWQGDIFLNEDFTRDNLVIQRESNPYPIIHLATHANFRPGKASNSYIQLWGTEQIKLNEMRELGWNEPAVELLVLSACRTAFGDRNAELGFAGLAIAAGVKSALASVWYVNDEGTLGLMTEFYSHLNNVKTKAEALRRAQLAMLRGEVVIVDGKLRGSGTKGVVTLPPALENLENHNLSHPYYWAGFTMVGSPW
ncbi:MAG: CHAT domain-containing protein, partial [Okeania sp. SIO3B5]|uniref:CHAT domain-containing protein n=1 Tax=Okeania sp. SIO3B5 TaxID=2607811 RepID=UPI0014002CD7